MYLMLVCGKLVNRSVSLTYLPHLHLSLPLSLPPSRLGGACNPGANVVDDPHFTGALGTRFDFNGHPGGSFCLHTDRQLHINAVLGGYEGDPLATGFDNSTKTTRTWIQ